MILCKAMTKILYGKSFLECEKNDFKKHLPALFPREFFMFVLIISNHTVFLFQFKINLLKLHSPMLVVQFQFFAEKLTRAN